MYKVLHDTAPRYLGPFRRVADDPDRRTLRSAGTSSCLVVPPVNFQLSAAEHFRLLPLMDVSQHQFCGRFSSD